MLAAQSSAVLGHVQGKPSDGDGAGGRHGGGRAHGGAAQVGLDVHHQLAWVEGLDHIVVAPGCEPDALVHDVPFGRQEDDRYRDAPGAQFAAGGEAVHLRHHDVHDDEIGSLASDGVQRIGAVVGVSELPLGAFHHVAHHPGNARFIVHEQNLRHRRPPSRLSAARPSALRAALRFYDSSSSSSMTGA